MYMSTTRRSRQPQSTDCLRDRGSRMVGGEGIPINHLGGEPTTTTTTTTTTTSGSDLRGIFRYYSQLLTQCRIGRGQPRSLAMSFGEIP